MINFIKRKLKSILYFIELNLKVKVSNKTPVDIYLDKLSEDSYLFFENKMKQSQIFSKDEDIRKYSISTAIDNDNEKNNLYLEFGVFKAESINLFSNILKNYNLTISGFDSFEGLDETWITNEFNPIGTFSLKGKTPKVSSNVNLIKGNVQETLDKFLKNNSDKKIIFAHMDMDTYKATRYALSKIKPYLRKGSVILFDEFYGFPNWKNYEFKAFSEIFQESEYKYLAFCTRQVAVEIL